MTQLLVQLKHQTYPCEIMHSKRARYLRVKLSHSGNLSVVVPNGIGAKTVKDFVASQADWIERKLGELTSIGIESNQPAQLNLIYLNEIWDLEYLPDSALQSMSMSVEDSFKLKCVGKVGDVTLLHKVLGIWLKKKAEEIIPERLGVLAEQHGFHFNRVTIRGQKTRWGSCSTKKNINLNYKLLFLEPALVDYVLIHELCHTIEMNHSRRFWSLVADCDSNYKQHDKQLNKLSRMLPL